MAKVFFSHASEDKGVVEAVYAEFAVAHPEHEPWVDMYEIVGGDSLLDKIARGMDESEKFFIFLSTVSVTKPWVKAELRRALMREIDNVEPSYIVPVKVGDLSTIPAWLEDKLYIDLGKLTKDEWLSQFDAAITGTPLGPPGPGGNSNIECRLAYGPEGTHVAHIEISAVAWAETFAFAVATNEDLVIGEDASMGMHEMEVLVGTSFAFHEPRFIRQKQLLGVRYEAPELRPGKPVTMRAEFELGVDAIEAIESVSRWE
jgi:hypothetical protein